MYKSIGELVHVLQGQQVTHFEDHSLLRPRSHASSVYINHAQDLIVSLCQVLAGSKRLEWPESDWFHDQPSIAVDGILYFKQDSPLKASS